jgi:hypothetical protein
MPYDLYGQYYATEAAAMNAEMAQCAAIDASIAIQRQTDFERNLAPWQEHIEERLRFLEAFLPISLCEGESK